MQTLPCCINHKHYTKSEKCNLFTTYAHGNGNDRWMILLHYIKLLYMQSWWFIRGGNRLYMCIFFKSTLFLSQSKFTNTFKPKICCFLFVLYLIVHAILEVYFMLYILLNGKHIQTWVYLWSGAINLKKWEVYKLNKNLHIVKYSVVTLDYAYIILNFMDMNLLIIIRTTSTCLGCTST